jgi:hypothetical protein
LPVNAAILWRATAKNGRFAVVLLNLWEIPSFDNRQNTFQQVGRRVSQFMMQR